VPKEQPLEPQEIEPQAPREIRAQDENATIFKELLSLQEKESELSSMLVKQNQLNNLPVKEPPVFSGDPLVYPAFITAFDSTISQNVSSNMDRLYFWGAM